MLNAGGKLEIQLGILRLISDLPNLLVGNQEITRITPSLLFPSPSVFIFMKVQVHNF